MLRQYPAGFGKKLLEIFWAAPVQGRLPLRYCENLDLGLTDKELFENLDFGDPWHDADMLEIFEYLYNHRNTHIPDPWHATMADYRQALRDSAAWWE